MHDLLRQNIQYSVSLPEDQLQTVLDVFSPTEYKKGDTVPTRQAGRRFAYFIAKGALRTYLIDDKGIDNSLEISFEGGWTGDIHAFLYDQPSDVTIVCLENVRLLRISFSELRALLAQTPALEPYFRTLYSHAYAAYFKRITEFISWSAGRRYRDLLENRPEVFERVPLKVIASYLGVTPESLSRIRKQVAEER